MPGTILVVDDDPTVRMLLERFLGAENYDVVTAQDGRAALDVLSRLHPDLILLDAVMPKPDGFEVCRRLKRDPETRLTPVVLVTGLASSTEDRVRGLDAGADGFLRKPFEHAELLARVRSLLSLKAYTDELERAESVLFAMARTIEGKDPHLEGHCERLAAYSSCLGLRLGLAEEQIIALQRAGIVHDIGKIGVPDAILLKPGPLTRAEWKVMWQHPMIGERICAPLKAFRLVVPIIRHHHEKLDGSGYPDGLRGDRIPITARVLQMADLYDGLTTKRPYKRAFTPAEAFEIIAQEAQKGWWDRDLFQELQHMLAESNGKSPVVEDPVLSK
ncbi:MAG: response regulator [Acidobacteria bacterium]|nr:response regulator [Acidobacteriota bacterium]